MSAAPTVLLMAAGTGGHVQPALVVAARLVAAGLRVEWLGTAAGIESRLVPAAGYRLHRIAIGGVRGKGLGGWLAAGPRLLAALAAALALIGRLRPALALGMGGYVTAPGGLAAWLSRTPLVIHEQNAVPGLANRLLAPLASRVLEAFPGSFPARRRALCTGNPVRPEIAALAPPGERLAGRAGALRLLVLGGSQGARALNRVLPEAVARCPARLELRHQCGPRQLEAARAAWRAAGLAIEPEPYIEDMAAAYAWADLVLARAGAMTVAELAAAGIGALLVPYPFAVDDHQRHNARPLVEAGAAQLVEERELDAATLAALLEALAGDRARLLEMACRARELARPEAGERVAARCAELLDE